MYVPLKETTESDVTIVKFRKGRELTFGCLTKMSNKTKRFKYFESICNTPLSFFYRVGESHIYLCNAKGNDSNNYTKAFLVIHGKKQYKIDESQVQLLKALNVVFTKRAKVEVEHINVFDK